MVVKREHTHAGGHHTGRSEVEGEEGREVEQKATSTGKDASGPAGVARVGRQRQAPPENHTSIP